MANTAEETMCRGARCIGSKWFVLACFFACIAASSGAHAADVTVAWDPNPPGEGVTNYRIEMTQDLASQTPTWTEVMTVGAVTQADVTVPDAGLVLLRVVAIGPGGETTRLDAGAWYNGDWKPYTPPSAAGVK